MQNELSTLKCKTHQDDNLEFVCMCPKCQAKKLCCLKCRNNHADHDSYLKTINSFWEEIIQHKQKQIELNKTLEYIWSQIFALFPQFDQIKNFNTFIGFNDKFMKQSLVELKQEVQQELNCQDLQDITQKYQELCSSFNQKVQISVEKNYHLDKNNKLNVNKMLQIFNEARSLYKKRERQQAIDKYTQVLDMNENYILARLDRGKMNVGLNYEQAIFDFEEVLKQDDQNFRALKGLAVCYKMRCNYEEALYYAQKGRKLNESSPQLNFHLADCYKFESENKEALHYINIAIDQKKSKYENKMKVYLKNKAEILLGLNDLQNAYIFINKALDIYQHYVLAINIKDRIKQRAIDQNIVL